MLGHTPPWSAATDDVLATCSGTEKQWSRRSNRSTSRASPIYDLALIFSDGAHRAHGLVPRVCPTGSGAGDGELVMMAANMVVSLRRP